jgi:hypothetical protein
MDWKRALTKIRRPAANVVTKVVTRSISGRLGGLEGAVGDTRSDITELQAYLPAVEAVPALVEAAQVDVRAEIAELKAFLPVILTAISDQNAIARTAVRAENELSQQIADLGRRLAALERRLAAVGDASGAAPTAG